MLYTLYYILYTIYTNQNWSNLISVLINPLANPVAKSLLDGYTSGKRILIQKYFLNKEIKVNYAIIDNFQCLHISRSRTGNFGVIKKLRKMQSGFRDRCFPSKYIEENVNKVWLQ